MGCVMFLTLSCLSVSVSLSVIGLFFGSRPQLTTGPITAALTEKHSIRPASSSFNSAPVFLQATPSFCSTLITMETQGWEPLPSGPVVVVTEEEAEWEEPVSSSLLLFLPAVWPPSVSSSSTVCFLPVTSPPDPSPLCRRCVTMATDGLRMQTWPKENCR